MRVLWLVPARSGSKGIHDKNIKILGDKPLLAYRILNTPDLKNGSELWLSTDSKEYSEIAKKYGCKVPFIRPEYLSRDDSSSIDVVLHAMEFSESSELTFDYIGLLEPTSPFVSKMDLINALTELDNDRDANSIVAVRESRPNTNFIQDESKYLSIISSKIKSLSKVSRQNFVKQITPSGGFYISRWDNFKYHKTFYTQKTLPYMLDDIRGLEIDEPFDWLIAETIINNILENERISAL